MLIIFNKPHWSYSDDSFRGEKKVFYKIVAANLWDDFLFFSSVYFTFSSSGYQNYFRYLSGSLIFISIEFITVNVDCSCQSEKSEGAEINETWERIILNIHVMFNNKIGSFILNCFIKKEFKGTVYLPFLHWKAPIVVDLTQWAINLQ